MFKKLFIFLLLLFLSAQIYGQKKYGQNVEINPYMGFFFGGNLYVKEGKLNIKDDINYGGTISFKLQDELRGELSYNRTSTKLKLVESGFGDVKDLFDLGVTYVHGGITWASQNGKIQPFGLISTGIAIFSPDSRKYGSEWMWSVSFGGGVKYYFTKHVGLRLQARLNVPFLFYGGTFYAGSGGIGYGVTGGSAIAQGDITLGLIYAIPR